MRPTPTQRAWRPAIAVLASQIRHRWYLVGPLGVIWALACQRVLIDPTPHVPLLFNWTPSLPYTVAYFEGRRDALKRGDYIIFSFDGEASRSYPGLHRQPFFKRIRGLPGDVVTVDNRVIAINGVPVGTAKTHTFDHRPLTPLSPTVIPPGSYYVEGTSADSFDSRYRESGLVRGDRILGTVIPLF